MWIFASKVMYLLFNMLSRIVITFLPRSKCLLISWMQSPSAVILEPPKIVCHCFHCFPNYLCKVMETDAPIFTFWMLSFKSAFSLSCFTFIKGILVPLYFLPQECCHLHIWGYLIFLPEILIPAYASSSPAFLMMSSAYKLNRQGNNIQPWHTPFLIWNQSVVPCPVDLHTDFSGGRSGGLVVPDHLFKNFPWFIVIHTVKRFSTVNEAEVDVFLELSCFFDDPVDALAVIYTDQYPICTSSSNVNTVP